MFIIKSNKRSFKLIVISACSEERTSEGHRQIDLQRSMLQGTPITKDDSKLNYFITIGKQHQISFVLLRLFSGVQGNPSCFDARVFVGLGHYKHRSNFKINCSHLSVKLFERSRHPTPRGWGVLLHYLLEQFSWGPCTCKARVARMHPPPIKSFTP
jgi:hypothetical protein